MNATSTWLRAAALGVMVWGTTAASGCAAEVVAEPTYYPPPGFIATTAPVYYEGRPAYFYNDRWYFRSGGGWGYYRSEPHYLYNQRTVYGPAAHAYVRGGGARVVVHAR
jgi:hypothetical protein